MVVNYMVTKATLGQTGRSKAAQKPVSGETSPADRQREPDVAEGRN